MRTPSAKACAALFGCVTAVVLAAGLSSGGAPAATATPSVVTPAPPAPGGAVPVQPVGGGGCIIGLNCGCIRKVTCPSPHPRRPSVDSNQHAAPAPANP
ncbi:hypothetical protein B8W69_19160 [Mycobacterium vulneris]|jgi:hypothetical protein|uniref:Secreted protein n=1 Tax=Mycolicibacterium vulneris TaxID=547163 RepID=A0A1X2KUH7_9MYCO|nr:hypothetical protein [Mycolicibacterium vulneris]OSC25408.1 hypothetical protein B8W69_19160 [Mycolicibacterium vulneris]